MKRNHCLMRCHCEQKECVQLIGKAFILQCHCYKQGFGDAEKDKFATIYNVLFVFQMTFEIYKYRKTTIDIHHLINGTEQIAIEVFFLLLTKYECHPRVKQINRNHCISSGGIAIEIITPYY